MEKQATIFSFFAGAGFLDLGFEMAGFKVAYVNEIFDIRFGKLPIIKLVCSMDLSPCFRGRGRAFLTTDLVRLFNRA